MLILKKKFLGEVFFIFRFVANRYFKDNNNQLNKLVLHFFKSHFLVILFIKISFIYLNILSLILYKQKFRMSANNSGVILHGKVEEILKKHETYISEDLLDKILRGIDIEKNGEYTENEFLQIMKSIHVKTPEDVIEDHVKNIIDSKI